MLTRFSPIFTSDVAAVILIIIACFSVLVGSGISLVHVDYKRQLVGSTMGQMGFMLIQCALGAYIAAIIHLILHGAEPDLKNKVALNSPCNIKCIIAAI